MQHFVSMPKKDKSHFRDISQKEMIFFHKSKVTTFKKLRKKRKFRAIRSILSFFQRPLVDFWRIWNFYGKTDHIGKISMVSMCLKHVQSPRRINFWVIHFQLSSAHSVSFMICPFLQESVTTTTIDVAKSLMKFAIWQH